jgi:wyosine [tRNA(Phe)-imidazoG37] synthetase (radical SAM superfamily)
LAAPTIQPLEAPLPVLPDSPLIFGPKKLDRLGLTMAVDLGGDDVVLSVSRETRMPRASVVVTTAARYIIRTAKTGEKLETLAIHGTVNDPTLHPEFRAIATNLRDLRNKWFAKAKLVLVTDNPNFDNGDVRTILSIFDRIVVRLEAGTAKTYAALTGKKSGDYATFVSQLPASEKLTIQARFYKGEVDNTADAEVKAWVKKLGELKPREVYLLNPEAKPTNKKLKPAPKARISEIGKELTEKTGIQAVILSTPSVLG